MARYKHLIGPKLRARSLPAQRGEVAIAVAALNRMIRTAKPVSIPGRLDGAREGPAQPSASPCNNADASAIGLAPSLPPNKSRPCSDQGGYAGEAVCAGLVTYAVVLSDLRVGAERTRVCDVLGRVVVDISAGDDPVRRLVLLDPLLQRT